MNPGALKVDMNPPLDGGWIVLIHPVLPVELRFCRCAALRKVQVSSFALQHACRPFGTRRELARDTSNSQLQSETS